MQDAQLKILKKWFTDFVRDFYTADDAFINRHVQLKECHTHRVCNEMRQLTAALEMDDNDRQIAETIALLHDVGRFPQIQIYRTYKDERSENHCLLALKVLAQQNLLADLADDEREVIEKSIEFHGVKDLPTLDEQTMHFAKLIRDADKIDIFDLLIKYYRQLAEDPETFGKEVIEYSTSPECNPEIIDALMNHKLIHYEQIKTINDAKLMQLGWVYDIYFDWSLKQIHSRGYLQEIIDLLPKTKPVKQATDCILDYTKERNNR
ncbi:MAG: phosphohydrolase [Planctomycetota bacterium]|nr:MAG: phosphohydrolase [Planctomycetota bacterium]